MTTDHNPDCLFCKIVHGDIPARRIYEDDLVLAFDDVNPQAPVHFLVIPKIHIATLNDLQPEHEVVVGRMHRVAKQVAAERGIAESGYRTVANCGDDGLQSVYHIHLHVLGGRAMQWPPG